MKYIAGAQGNNTKKSLGQHWLKDQPTLEAIVAAAEVNSGDEVLEIGPGLGTLTDVLLSKDAKVLALEFDQDLLPKLEQKYDNNHSIKLVQGDIRSFDFDSMSKSYKIVANIPYYLTSNLIRSISETINQPEITALLIQKEVAQRICAKPGQMGILSVTAQFYFDCSLNIEVPAELFTPPPKVDSQVVVLRKRSQKLFDVIDQDFFTFVKAGFSEKRKTLPNAFSGSLQIAKATSVILLEKSGLKATARAQELSLNDWFTLYSEYGKRD